MATLPPTPTPTMATNHESTQPTCQNCQTSTTPLWRRDEMGSVLCNACGLFLKLHGRPRPISLKTDVIKSRNRVKTVRPDMQMKKKVSRRIPPRAGLETLAHFVLQQSLPASVADSNGFNTQGHENAAAALAAVRRSSQHKPNGHDDSPLSRTGTPSMYDPHLPVFNGVDGHQYQSSGLPQYPLPTGGSPGRPGSPMNGEARLDASETREQLIANNSSLKTRVSELEVINELFRSRLTQLEADQMSSDNFRHQAEEAARAEAEERQRREDIQRKHEETQRQLDDSHRRENAFKRRLDEMEQELKDAKEQIEKLEKDAVEDRPSKKPRLEESAKEESEAAPTPQSTS
ncbi:hypothetical protein JX265_000069 [Neoarthrinium moseri]|uniref:GATA-type domain-containing protein n=1 Tax=Neoarthrinium moseri TaxID=1658444 RepID=A0A9P9WXR7_9PEZI|nr:hypothetical protein JX266_008117 [Neoarthrinium moseri]KAI1881243.1 hypothetical protein JX265_000069 [Neoarthrinium moseri]